MHAASDQMVKGFDSGRQIQLHVASFGFKADGTATLLWERSVGGAPITLNATDVEGMGTPTDTILRIEARMTYSSPFKYVWSSTARSTKAISYFRPRETRAISMDGAISEYDQNWDYIPPSS